MSVYGSEAKPKSGNAKVISWLPSVQYPAGNDTVAKNTLGPVAHTDSAAAHPTLDISIEHASRNAPSRPSIRRTGDLLARNRALADGSISPLAQRG